MLHIQDSPSDTGHANQLDVSTPAGIDVAVQHRQSNQERARGHHQSGEEGWKDESTGRVDTTGPVLKSFGGIWGIACRLEIKRTRRAHQGVSRRESPMTR